MIRKRYADLAWGRQLQQTHYREAGAGQPLIMLHPSPLSGGFLEPLIERFSSRVRVLAPDTPGYGRSDPLPQPGEDLSAYVDWLRRFQDELGLPCSGLYGSATGAQVAIEFARAHPDRVAFLVLENAVHFTDEEREWILADYFPDMTPRADGAHFERAWEMSARLFQRFPWFDDRPESDLGLPTPPVEVINATAIAYLLAGPDYQRAYRAAFLNEHAGRLQAVPCPTRVIRWQGSILRRYADRLDDFDWPVHIRMVHCGPDPGQRFEALTNVIAEFTAR